MIRPGDLATRSASIAAVATVVVNDHLLKQRYGSWLTGKLSDVAGVFVLPLVMLSLLEVGRWAFRRSSWVATDRETLVAVMITAAGFAAVKMYIPAGDAYATAIGAVRWIPRFLAGSPIVFTPIEVTRDWTDTAVLPVLLGSWAVARARSESTPAPP